MAGQDSGYFGMKIGEALSSGAGHIASALQRRYEIQRQAEMRRQEQERMQAAQQQQMQMGFAAQGVQYDPRNPAASFEAMRGQVAGKRQMEEKGAMLEQAKTQAEIDALKAKTAGMPDATANMGYTQTAPAELTAQYGVPSTRVNPYANMPENVRTKVQPANISYANKLIEKANAAQDTAEGAKAELDRVTALLNSGMATGPFVGRAKKLGQYVIPGDELATQVGTFEQVANKLIPTMRQGMPGAASDRDVAMFAKATIGIDKTPEVNKKIIDQAQAVNRRISDKADFLAAYVNAYGDAQGAQVAWDKYVNDTPLFDDNGAPLPYKTYAEYFGAAQEGQGATAPSGMTPEKKQRLMELRAKKAQGTLRR